MHVVSLPAAQVTDGCEENATVVVETPPEGPYSIFTILEKKWISYVASFGAMFSTMSSYIYFPALVPMAADLDVSVALINLTVTSYLVVAGIAPAFMGDLADQGGRRPAYILMFTLVPVLQAGFSPPKGSGLQLTDQITGSYSAAYGIVADITAVSERGSYVGSMIVFTNAAPSFGPVIAGALAQQSWRWIFWFLVILTGAYLLVVLTLLPETQRKIVGNGSVKSRGAHKSLFDFFTRDRQTTIDDPRRGNAGGGGDHHIPNPFKCIVMLFSKGNFTVILTGSITYTVKMTLQSSLAAQCIDVYSLNYLQSGLIYLPSGVGGAIASFTTGLCSRAEASFWTEISERFRSAKEETPRIDGVTTFPIEEARLNGVYVLVTLSAVITAGYGISLMQEAICGTLLTDLNPQASATVQASYNLVRCIGAGAAIADQQPLTDATNSGWCFGVFALIMMFAAPLALLERRGPRWRT
ncbi:hypothetical protein CPLU01_12333 [Colletotrichum plurivorum]|uniref:Major facilitator superfamily (MFS) profile domain-containing protein n=1 Tax=Colletotrichum plurivorum TaxID=2175906 RepID=A0A8H6N723_9PEZI|nr:hypothetical protein CPLU01_12333 [Colletotrichum plurivorum]